MSEEAHPTPEQIQRLRARLLEGRAQAGAGSMLGRLNCTAAGYICRRFGFSGPSHSTGAACAASMAALFDAWTLLRAGVIDAAVVGGGEEKYAPLPYAEFCAMGALALVEVLLRPAGASLTNETGELSVQGKVTDVLFHQSGFKVTLDNGLYFYLPLAPKIGDDLMIRTGGVECLG